MSYCSSTSDKSHAAKAGAEDQASVFQITLNHVFSPLYVGKKTTKSPFFLTGLIFLAFSSLSVTFKPSETGECLVTLRAEAELSLALQG